MSVVHGSLCLNCQKKKPVKKTITLGQSVGFICSSCYDSNIWAQKEDNRKQVYSFSDQSLQRLFSMSTDTKRGMEELINEHYKNKTAKAHWVNELKNKSNRIQFYKNHLKKWVDEYLDFKEEQLRRRTSGIASLLKLPKRPRKH